MRRSLLLLLALILLVPAHALASCGPQGAKHACCKASAGASLSHACGMPSCEASPEGGIAQGLPSASAQVHAPVALALASDAISPDAARAGSVARPTGTLAARAAPELSLLSSFRN